MGEPHHRSTAWFLSNPERDAGIATGQDQLPPQYIRHLVIAMSRQEASYSIYGSSVHHVHCHHPWNRVNTSSTLSCTGVAVDQMVGSSATIIWINKLRAAVRFPFPALTIFGAPTEPSAAQSPPQILLVSTASPATQVGNLGLCDQRCDHQPKRW